MDRSVHQLRDEFFRLLDRPGDRSERWLAIWRLFVADPWYQSELRLAAMRLVERAHLPAHWAEDVQQRAILIFAQELSRGADLHIHRDQAEDRFPGWLATVIQHDCAQALRILHSGKCRTTPLRRDDDVIDARANPERRIELSLAIENLPAPMRIVVDLFSQGWSVREIAKSRGVSYWQAYRVLQSGLARLATML